MSMVKKFIAEFIVKTIFSNMLNILRLVMSTCNFQISLSASLFNQLTPLSIMEINSTPSRAAYIGKESLYIHAYTDGSAHNKGQFKGIGGYGVLLQVRRGQEVLKEKEVSVPLPSSILLSFSLGVCRCVC